jgi:hypothetical protein
LAEVRKKLRLEKTGSSHSTDAMAMKYDRGKPPLGIIPKVALDECAYALGVGVDKYSKHNYINGGMKYSRLADAALRHIYAWLSGEDWDADRQELHHLGCALAELSMLVHVIDEGKGEDDRLEYERDTFGVIAGERAFRLTKGVLFNGNGEEEETSR